MNDSAFTPSGELLAMAVHCQRMTAARRELEWVRARLVELDAMEHVETGHVFEARDLRRRLPMLVDAANTMKSFVNLFSDATRPRWPMRSASRWL